MTLIKNEKVYLNEFIDYYLNLGVDCIYIYDDESTDGTNFLLKKYIKNKTVVYNKIVRRNKNFKFINRWGHYKHFSKNYSKKYDWLMSFDCDEYLSFPSNQSFNNNITIKKYLNYCEGKNINAIIVEMFNFLPIK